MKSFPRLVLCVSIPCLLASLPLRPLPAAAANELKTIAEYQEKAAKFNAQLTLPTFEQSPAEVEKAAVNTLAEADRGLDKIGKQDLGGVAFATTVGALDDVNYAVNTLANRLNLVNQTHRDAAMRQAAEDAIKKVQDWGVGVDYRQDVYNAVQAYAKTEPKLEGEEARLLAYVLRDYRRAGLELPAEQRQEIERMRKELAALSTDFSTNITKTVAPVVFTKEELDGVPEDFLNSPNVKGADGKYTVRVNETYQFILVQDNAKNEQTRRKTYVARDSMTAEVNVPLLNKILALRNGIALKLGYKSWADFQTEVKMAKTGAEAEQFIDAMIAGTQPKFAAEVADMQKLKIIDLYGKGDVVNGHAIINVWDWRYYTNQIRKTRFAIDTEALRVYFPMEKVLAGMFRVYEQNFGLKFTEVQAPYKWVDDLRLFVAEDAASGEPMGLFYLDLFPREGKYNHFAEFGIIEGKLLPDGKYQRPVVSLVCNFPPPGADGKPSLLSHDDVTTVFHEFGHALHAMLTRARFGRFAGTSVPGDFVEAPSQMLENWAWDKTVLDSFATDYRDPAKKIPAEILGKMKEAKLATAGVHYRRQFAFAKADLVLHDPHPLDQPYDSVAISNPVLEKVFLPIDAHTAMVGSFGHLMGYDAGYYGYAWADAIAADMATVFSGSPGGFMDKGAGMKLRTEIYQPGDSRDVGVSVEKFLGRKQSINPFLANTLGLKKDADPKDAAGARTGASAPTVK